MVSVMLSMYGIHVCHYTTVLLVQLVDVPPSTLGKVRIIRGYVWFLFGFFLDYCLDSVWIPVWILSGGL